MIQRYDRDGPITNENAWGESSANASKPQTVPPTAAYAFLFEKIRNCNQAEMQWNASFLDIHSFIEI